MLWSLGVEWSGGGGALAPFLAFLFPCFGFGFSVVLAVAVLRLHTSEFLLVLNIVKSLFLLLGDFDSFDLFSQEGITLNCNSEGKEREGASLFSNFSEKN